MAVAGHLREALSGLVGRHRSVVDLTADLPLKHGRVDEGGFGMRVTRRVAARAVFDEHALDALAWNVRQLVLVDEGHLGVLRLRRIREDAAEWQGGDKQRTEPLSGTAYAGSDHGRHEGPHCRSSQTHCPAS